MKWYQNLLTLNPDGKGCHVITAEILSAMPQIKELKTGILHIFLQHTSASLTINENADPDVRRDMEMGASKIVSDNLPYHHTLEGTDDMPAHIKTSIFGFDLTIPVVSGRLGLGSWQGIYLMEHRNCPPARKLILTLSGC